MSSVWAQLFGNFPKAAKELTHEERENLNNHRSRTPREKTESGPDGFTAECFQNLGKKQHQFHTNSLTEKESKHFRIHL